MTGFQWFCFFSILAISVAGGYYPLFRNNKVIGEHDFPKGKAFTSGVFLALSLTVMLPGAFSLWGKLLDFKGYPMATYIAIGVFVVLLALEHRLDHYKQDHQARSMIIPIIMTLMIGICSFLLGTALGVSGTLSALMVFLAIMAHKGSASFALALTMVKSKMSVRQCYLAFGCFALATPMGIVLGAVLHQYLTDHTALVFKAVITSLAAGVFLYLATTHGLRHTPFVKNCQSNTNFFMMLLGLLVTMAVSFLLSYAKTLH